MDLNIGKYKSVKMAIVRMTNERDIYINFNTESTALCLESLGQLWNLVVLELTETDENYEADHKAMDKMEECKLPIKVVSVLRRNLESGSSAAGSSGGPMAKKALLESNPLLRELNSQLSDMNRSELMEMYNFAMHLKSKRTLLPTPPPSVMES